jgi:alkylhydroperoxidase/carboxymuconolactone decarboxylase family protein YurZ
VREQGATQRRLRLTADRAEDDVAAESEVWTRRSTRDQAGAMARVAALIASGAGDSAYRRCVQSAVATGATPDELINMLRAVARSVGIARVVAATPALALALVYNFYVKIEDPPHSESHLCGDPE